MTNGRVEVITSVERRRRWSSAEKQLLVAATNWAVMPALIDQPITRRENRSITADT